MKRSQSSTEFVILVTFMLMVFVVFLILIQGKLKTTIEQRNDQIAQNVLDMALNEVRLAESVSDSYNRQFLLPTRPNGLNYNVRIVPGAAGSAELVLVYDDKERIAFLDSAISNASSIGIGYNNISKYNGIVTIRKS